MSFSTKLKELRISNNLSQDQLAKEINITKGIIWKYEQNKATPSAEILKKLAQFFKVTTDYLLFDEDEKEIINKISDKTFLEKYLKIMQLNPKDKEYIETTIDLILEKNKKQN